MTFDYIIIGAGSAGCVLANRLSADPGVSVLLLEAGGPDKKLEIHIPAAYSKLNRTAVDWAFWTEPQKHVLGRTMYQPRGKTLGGCSSTNAMAYIRGNRQDFDDWAALGNTGWSYDDVLPYFKRSERNEQIGQLDGRYHGADGPLNVTFATRYRTPLADAFVESCAQTGLNRTLDFNGARQLGAGFFQFTIKDGKRHSTATAFLKPVLNRPNLTVVTHAHTKRIVLEGGVATGVEFLTGRHSTEKAFARREVLLSAGAFNSPQLLMLSGIGPREVLQRYGIGVRCERPGVGQNLQDHVFTGVSSLCSQRGISSNFHLKPLNQVRGLLQFMLRKEGPFTISPLEANAFLNVTDQTAERPDMQLHFAPVHVGDQYPDMYDVANYPHTDGYTILPTVLKPKSVGYVSIRSANPLDAPLINPQYMRHEDDRAVLLRGVKKAVDVMQADGFGPYCQRLQTPPDRRSDEAMLLHALKQLETVYHPVGTCKMGPAADPMAVVDADLRVHGVGGLRVIDASIMPTIVAGNTNAACIMIGEKGADLVLGRTAAGVGQQTVTL